MTVQAEPLLDASQIAANAAAISVLSASLAGHIGDSSIHFTVGSIDHTAILNIGSNSHAVIDTHIANGGIHYTDAPADGMDYVRRDNAWVLQTVAAGFNGLGTWRYRTEIVEPPASGQLRFNNADPELATLLWVHETNDDAVDVENFLDLLTTGSLIYIQDKNNSANFMVVEITTNTDDGAYREFGIDVAEVQGSVPSQNAEVIVVTVSGGTGAVPTVQQTYDSTGGVPHIVLVGGQPFTIRDNAAPIGTLVEVQDGAGVPRLRVAPLQVDFGQSMTDRFVSLQDVVDGYGAFEFYPDGRTRTDAGSNPACNWTSTVNSLVPGGGGVGNDTAPNFVSWIGELVLTEQGNLFNTQSLFNQATTVTLEGANTGPIYTMINQPLFRTGALGGSRTGSQQNAVRSQIRIGPNLAGNFLLTSHETYFATCIIDATVGTAGITTVNYFAPKAPTLTAGGFITTLNLCDFPNIPGAGITTLRGINSAMVAGTFINHTGSAPSLFSGPLAMANAIELRLGGATANDVALARSAADTMQWTATGVMAWDLNTATADAMRCFSAADSLTFDFPTLSFGTTLADPTANWQALFSPGVKTVTVGGDFARRLFSASGAVLLNAAMSNAFTDVVNEPFIDGASTGSAVNTGNVLIQTGPGFGTNRYGLLITANPSGGTLNYAFRQSNASALARFDGRLDINRGIALGGGAAATLGTIGGSGPTAAAQAQWVEIDIGGTAHWIPVWT